jgi:hypothetical protein
MTVAGVISRCAFSAWGRSLISAVSVARSAQSDRGLGLVRRRDRVLVAEDQDLDLLGGAAAGEQGQPFGGAAEGEVEQA